MPLLPDNDPFKRWNDYRAQKQAESKPISEPDLRTVERIQNYKIAELENRITQLEAQLSQRPNWHINVPKLPYKVVGWPTDFKQRNVFEPAPSPIDGPREYLEGEDELC